MEQVVLMKRVGWTVIICLSGHGDTKPPITGVPSFTVLRAIWGVLLLMVLTSMKGPLA